MPRIDLNDNPFYGSVSKPGTAITIDSSCLGCGSSLVKRREKSVREVIGGVTYLVQRYRCRCGRRKEVRRAM